MLMCTRLQYLLGRGGIFAKSGEAGLSPGVDSGVGKGRGTEKFRFTLLQRGTNY